MSTLSANATLGDVAEILRAAIALGPDAWEGGGGGQNENAGRPKPGPGFEDELKELFRILNERKIPYLLVGGIAMLRYVDGRNTQDVDLILSTESLAQLPEIVITDQNREFARAKFRGVRVDFLFTSNPVFKLVAAKYSTKQKFADAEVPCATVEGLILLKLYALPSLYRQFRSPKILLYENDIAMLYERHHPNTAPLLEAIEPFVEEGALMELRNIVADIQKRIDRVEKGGGVGQPEK